VPAPAISDSYSGGLSPYMTLDLQNIQARARDRTRT
jgi:hypothetical protein